MNLIAHAVVSYAIGVHLTDDPLLILFAVFFGLLPDFDHISHLPRAIATGRFGPRSRSRIHELYGLTIAAVFAAAAYYIRPALTPLVFLPLLAHHLMDFLTRPTRPFNPVEDAEVHLKVYPNSLRGLTIADALVTGVFIVWLIL